jgi:hypothetical protein
MFIENDGEIKVEFYVREKTKWSVNVRQDLDDLSEEEKKKYEKVECKLRPLTWKQHNDLVRSATVNRGTGMGNELDWQSYKERKLCKILVAWDVKDKDGKPVPVTEANIFKLCPPVAEEILQQFDNATILGEEERKN